jgi:hypothetical protein
MEEVEHQQGFLQCSGSHGGDFGIVEQVDQRLDVVAADHGAEQFGGLGAETSAHFSVTVSHGSQERSLHLGRIIDASRHAVGDQFDQECSSPAGGP